MLHYEQIQTGLIISGVIYSSLLVVDAQIFSDVFILGSLETLGYSKGPGIS